MKRGREARRGFTLVEVVLALMVLGIGIFALVAAASRCLSSLKTAKAYHDARYTIDLGELEYPLVRTKDEVLNLNVPEETLENGLTFSRESEESEEYEGIYVVRTRASWPTRNGTAYEETVRYLYYTNDVP